MLYRLSMIIIFFYVKILQNNDGRNQIYLFSLNSQRLHYPPYFGNDRHDGRKPHEGRPVEDQ